MCSSDLDSLLAGRDGFQSATHTPGTANCPGFDWTVQGTGAVGLTAGSGDAIPSASASVTSRALTTALPNAKFTTLKSGVDTVVMRHRECNGACADTVIITVARTPKALRVEQGAGTIFAVGQTGQAIVIGALDSLGAITPVNGLGISTSAVTAGLTILAGGSGTMAAGLAPFPGLRFSGRVGTYQIRFTAPGSITPAVHTITLIAGPAAALTFVTSFPSSWPAGQPFVPCPSIQVTDIAGNPVQQAGIPVTMSTPTGPVTVNTNSAGIAEFCGLTMPTGTGPVTYTATSGSLPGASAPATVNRPVGPARLVVTPATSTDRKSTRLNSSHT